MKPIKLKFRGLNSFIDEQEIDFTKLSKGVFGIFGKTGSGKTTILDAIMLALFGQISKETKAMDFINSKCDEAGVELFFETGDEKRKTYFVERKYRKRKDNTVTSAWFGEVVSGSKQNLAEGVRDVDSCIKEVVGLSYSEFSKCIALPQGEFAGFLNATASERTEILSNIFSLQEYGDKLMEKVKSKYAEMETKRQVLEAQKAMLKTVSEKDIEDTEKLISSKKELIDSLLKNREEKNAVFQEQSKVKQLLEQQKETSNKLNALYLRRQEMINKNDLFEKQRRALNIESDIKKYYFLSEQTNKLKEEVIKLSEKKNEHINAYAEFVGANESFEKNYQVNALNLSQKEAVLIGASEDEMLVLSLRNQIELLKENLEEEQRLLFEFKTIFENVSKDLEGMKQHKDKLEEEIKELEENESIELTIKEIKDIESEIIIYENLEKRISALLDSQKDDLDYAQIEYTKLLEKEKRVRNSLRKTGLTIDDVLSGNLGSEFEAYKQLQEKLTRLKETKSQILFVEEMNAKNVLAIEDKRNLIDVLEKEKEEIVNEINQETIPEYKDKIIVKLAQKETEIIAVQNQIREVYLNIDHLKSYITRLFLKHVNNSSDREKDLDDLIVGIEKEIEKAESLFDSQSGERVQLIEIEKLKTEYGTRISMIKESRETLLDLLFGLQSYRAEHEFTIFNAKQMLEDKDISLKDGADIRRQKDVEYRNLLNALTEKLQEVNGYEKQVVEKENIVNSIKMKIDNINTQILEKEKKYKHLIGEETAKNVLNRVRNEIKNLSETFEFVVSKKEQLKKEVDEYVQKYKTNSLLLDEKAKELSDLSFNLNGKIFELGFKDFEEAKEYLASESDILKLQDEVSLYKQEVTICEKELDNLNHQLQDKVLIQKEYDLLKETINNLEIKINEENILIGTLYSSLEIMKNDYKKHVQIQKELPQVIKVLDDSKELINLLRGKALVEFIAEEYLDVITKNASEKLNMLMGGRYELAFVNQDFVVYDNFNDHKPRVVKTLSGGETFLVSLSLALAISETISFSSNKNMEFFFLDEGFGTLDEELVESVISALYKLESHNLNIGLISHVKELEEQIKNKIIVSPATDVKGSQIKIEYNL